MSKSSVRTQPEEPKVDRDPSGRFAFGNPGAPGNPFARRVAQIRKAMLQAVSDEDIAQIMAAMIQRAKEGHVQAAKLVMSYTLGKPEKATDPDRVDVEEWELQKDTAAMYETMADVVKAPPADLPLQHARLFRPLVGSILQNEITDLFVGKEKAAGEKPSTNDDLEGTTVRGACLRPAEA
jgi:hypothetical protein